jgi:hypothetical protein
MSGSWPSAVVFKRILSRTSVYSAPEQQRHRRARERLNLLEGFDLNPLGRNTAPYLHLIGEVMRLAIADRNRYVGDPHFVKVPVNGPDTTDFHVFAWKWRRQDDSLMLSDVDVDSAEGLQS